MKWYEKQKQQFEDKLKTNEMSTMNEETPTDSQSDEWKEGEQVMETNESTNEFDNKITSSSNGQDWVSQPIMDDKKRETTTIQAQTTFRGDIETNDNIAIYGTLIGNISCEADIIIYGSVQGNISCHNAIFKEATIEGDIECSNSLELSEKSILRGNVKAINLENGGQIKGDVAIEETAHFLSASAIVGNITALEIQVDRGCIIQGNISITESIHI